MKSPDSSLIAEVDQDICSGLMTTDVSNSISISKYGFRPEKDDVIFVLDVGGDYGMTPRIDWLSNEKLQVSVNRSVINAIDFIETSHNGIEIVLAPDTPAMNP